MSTELNKLIIEAMNELRVTATDEHLSEDGYQHEATNDTEYGKHSIYVNPHAGEEEIHVFQHAPDDRSVLRLTHGRVIFADTNISPNWVHNTHDMLNKALEYQP